MTSEIFMINIITLLNFKIKCMSSFNSAMETFIMIYIVIS